ncbi:hypothetical protein HDU85_005455 [Gaertneriomyces sp. JEL0708]|nr:hypothetical protein HDU85_005455 [Gaertneriomyces sp. JEL0708]
MAAVDKVTTGATARILPNGALGKDVPPTTPTGAQAEDAGKRGLASTIIPIGETPTPVAGVIAGVAKSFATKSAFAATAFGKGLLKWWFRVPVKFFRPYTVNPWLIVNHMAQAQGAKVGVGYVRSVVTHEGYGFFGKNIFPLLMANAAAGAVLFNVYGGLIFALSASSEDNPPSSLAAAIAFDHHHPFMAGAVAGASTSLIATPLENINRRITPSDLVANRHDGACKFVFRSISQALKGETTTWGKARRLYRGFGFIAAKDACGFGMFFGMFEFFRRLGKGIVADAWKLNSEPLDKERTSAGAPTRPASLIMANAAAVIAAGAAAGSAYQIVIYPLDNIPSVLAASQISRLTKNPIAVQAVASAKAPVYEDGFMNTNPSAGRPQRIRWKRVWKVLRAQGIRPFYAGIGPQLVRVMPPSAIGLFVYEIASQQYWDNDETW